MQISKCIGRRGVVGRDPAFQPGGPGSISGVVRNLNFYPGLCVYPLCTVLVVSGGGHYIVLTTHSGRPVLVNMSSVQVQSLLPPPPTGI